MRIAYVCADRGVPVFGQKGCSIHVQEIIRAFLGMGHKVDLLASRFGGACAPDLSSVATHILPRLANQEEPFESHVKILNQQIQEDLMRIGPVDLIYERYSLWSTGAMEYAYQNNIPGVLEVNAPLILEEKLHRHLLFEDLAVDCEAKVFQSAALIVGVSKEVCGYVQTKLKDQLEKVITVPNGVNLKKFKLINQLKTQRLNISTKTIGFVGSLKAWHGVELLLQAVAVLSSRNPDLRLLIVGDGPQKASLIALASSLGIAHAVEFTGAVSPEDIPQYLSHMDMAVAPYPAMDNFYFSPLKVYEYMAAGLPVVVSAIGQLKELIINRVNGLFFTPGDVQSLADSLDQLLKDPQLCAQLGTVAQKQMFEQFSWDMCAQRIIQAALNDKLSGVKGC